ncbi:glycosyltransferase family 2 protein [Sphingomonas sp.]|uniref:glycosyltransferase family 2 protein n=1 Tax=Sphingomonas sp. TaxID=28214 RepID=UPI001B2763F1|nr:glycosyltransferase family 2 protein [Sphingomonas sp.]MBO9711489.1 glycosyltransferase family 2 protein [Sphingomonas sp.]
MLDRITPVLLTMNEAPNIIRTLARLDWARDIVVVDSGSTDATLELLAANPRVRIFHRAFDTHAGQWRFAVEETRIATDWVLRMDADYLVTPELRGELAALEPPAGVDAYRVRFGYAMYGHPLLASLYPANTVLFRRGKAEVFDKGHTEGWRIAGPVGELEGRIVHDDRKPMSGWVGSQLRYMQRELPHMKASGGMKAWLRRHPPLMPVVTFLYVLFGRGLIFNGRAGMFYALQRLLAETMLSLLVIEERMKDEERD